MDSGGPSVALEVLELLRQRQCADSLDTRMPPDTTTLARELHTYPTSKLFYSRSYSLVPSHISSLIPSSQTRFLLLLYCK